MEKQLVPQLRFPYYDDNWNKVVLENITTKISDGIHSTPNYDLNGDYYFVNGNNLIDGVISINENTKKVTLEEFIKHKRPLSENSILLSINGTIGNLALYKNENIVLGKSACYINFKKGLPVDFYYYILQTPRIKKYFLSELTGSTIMNLSLKTVKGTKLIVPSIPEQQKIASFLTDVDHKITKLTKKKDLLEQYKKGIMQKIFSQKLRFKDDNGNAFPKWEIKKLGNVFSSFKGKGIPKGDVITDGNYKCVLYGELYTTYNEVINKVVSSTNSEDGLRSKKGDLLIPSSTTTTGIDLANVTALNFENILLGGDIIVMRGKKEINNVFYAYYLSNFKKHQIASRAQGITIVHIYFNSIKDLEIDVPVVEEQTKIANFLSDIDVKIEALNTKIEQCKAFKKGLLQKMFV